MAFRHPFLWITPSAQGSTLGVLTVLLVALSFILLRINESLYTAAAPYGMLSYNLAGSQAQASAVLASWSPGARAQALLWLGLDFLYLFVYPACFSLGGVRVSLRLFQHWPRFAYAGCWLVWLTLAAGLFDAVENTALVRQLVEAPTEGWAQLAWWCALPKFTLAMVGLGYVLAGSVISTFQPKQPRRKR